MIFAGPVGLIQCRRTDVMKMVYKHPGHKKLFALTVKNHYEVGGGGGNSHGLCIRWIDRP